MVEPTKQREERTESTKFVTMMKSGPRWEMLLSFAASEALVEEAGYSPPTPCASVSMPTQYMK